MWFWIFVLVMDLLIPITMITFGDIFKKSPPKEINDFYSYRTSRSKKSRASWEFAHHYFGGLWRIIGWIMLVVSALSMLFVMGKDKDTVGLFGLVLCLLWCVVMIAPVFPTEAALKRNFDAYGNPRT